MAACRNPQRLLPLFKGEIRVGDLRDTAYLDRLLAGIDIVCHSAGWTSFLNHEREMRKFYLEPTLELINRVFEWRIKRFVNLSSIAVTGLQAHAIDDAPGTPLRGCPMLNCLIAVENYLKAQSVNYPTGIINLRLGLYSGKRMSRGLINTLLNPARPGVTPYATGSRGFMPLVDGRDIGQAFARAALAPGIENYVSMNITGPEVPTQKDVINFLRSQQNTNQYLPLPTTLYRMAIKAMGLSPTIRLGQLSRCQLTMLSSPAVDSETARQLLGYDPATSWKASLLDTIMESQKPTDKSNLHDPVKQSDVI